MSAYVVESHSKTHCDPRHSGSGYLDDQETHSCSGTQIAMRLDARVIARMATMRQTLKVLGVGVRNAKRADCPLCRGKSTATLAFTERLWHCHRCCEGGDVFSLVRAVNRCDFPDALRFVAKLAGICVEDHRTVDFQRKLYARKMYRDRLEDGARRWSALEHSLLLGSRDLIHKAERGRQKASARLAALRRGEPERFRGEEARLWQTLQAAELLLRIELPIYTLLSFGAPEERARFVLHPKMRDQIMADVRSAGFVRTVDGKRVEVVS
jgi:hypothetical protein